MRLLSYDIEVLANFFCCSFQDIDTKQEYSFVIHESKDDSAQLITFLRQPDITLVGYNCNNFDYHLCLYLYNLNSKKTVKEMLKNLKSIAQKRIDSEFDYWGEFVIPQLDLLKINGFDNPAKRCSLKWLQINMGFDNVQEMPIHHSESIDASQIQTVLDYNLNDVRSTTELYSRSLKKIQLRDHLSSKYKIDMSNYPDTKIGEYIVLSKLSEKLNTPISDLKRCRSYAKEIAIKDVILPQIRFRSPEFQGLLNWYKQLIAKPEVKSQKKITFDSMEYVFGLGGVHGARESGTYSNIHSADVSGYYPSLAVAQKFKVSHFGEPFVEVYRGLKEERSQYKKGSDENEALKLAPNAVFGKSGNEYSPFFDLKFLYSITVNGQLALAMLAESLTLSGSCNLLMVNTDGIEVEMIDEDKFMKICGEWEGMFGVNLEHSKYKTMAMRDINNYLAIKDNGKIKLKGAFDDAPELHKNHSQLVVAKAIKAYYEKGTPVAKYINEETKINDFLLGVRAKTGYLALANGERLPKTVRYYVSTKGEVVYKHTEKKHEKIHVDSKVTIFNKWIDGPYDIDRQFYINEANKILKQLRSKKITKFEQLTLF